MAVTQWKPNFRNNIQKVSTEGKKNTCITK